MNINPSRPLRPPHAAPPGFGCRPPLVDVALDRSTVGRRPPRASTCLQRSEWFLFNSRLPVMICPAGLAMTTRVANATGKHVRADVSKTEWSLMAVVSTHEPVCGGM